jgi:hypothetical protein
MREHGELAGDTTCIGNYNIFLVQGGSTDPHEFHVDRHSRIPSGNIILK